MDSLQRKLSKSKKDVAYVEEREDSLRNQLEDVKQVLYMLFFDVLSYSLGLKRISSTPMTLRGSRRLRVKTLAEK